jgi:putative aldouronate transport system substrate-binding protein
MRKDGPMTRIAPLWALLLCGVLAFVLFIGCSGDSKPAPGQIAAETVTFYLITFNKIPDRYDQVEEAINKHIAAAYPEAQVKLKLQLFGPAEYEERIRLAMQSGSPIDLFTPWGIQTYISQNQVLPLENLLEAHGQETIAILKEDVGEDAFKTYEQNGHIYGVPLNKGMVVTPTLIYDKDMLAAAGYDINSINNFRDLEKVFTKIKEHYPDVYPYVETNAQDTFIIPLLIGEKEVDVLYDRATYMGVVFGGSGKVVNLYESPQFCEYIDVMRDWYNKGYLPKDLASSSSNATEYFSAGRAFCTMAGYGGNSIGVTVSASTGRNMGSKWIAPFYFDSSTASLATVIASTSKSPASAMKMLNLIYTDEFVINTILYGIEGVPAFNIEEQHPCPL